MTDAQQLILGAMLRHNIRCPVGITSQRTVLARVSPASAGLLNEFRATPGLPGRRGHTTTMIPIPHPVTRSGGRRFTDAYSANMPVAENEQFACGQSMNAERHAASVMNISSPATTLFSILPAAESWKETFLCYSMNKSTLFTREHCKMCSSHVVLRQGVRQ